MFAPAAHAEMDHLRYLETDADDWTTIGEIAVWGPLTEEQAREVLTGSVRNALRPLESGVIVGDVGQEVERQMATAIEASAEGIDGLTGEFLDTSVAEAVEVTDSHQ